MAENIARRAAAMGEYAKYAVLVTHSENTQRKHSRLEARLFPLIIGVTNTIDTLRGSYNSAAAFAMLLDQSIRYPWEYYCDYTLWHQKLRHREKNAKMA